MSVAEEIGRASAGAFLRRGRLAPRRTVEVRILVSGREEDAFAASRAGTLVKALEPILKHLDGRAAVEIVGVERSAPFLGSRERRQPLADVAEAVAFLRD